MSSQITILFGISIFTVILFGAVTIAPQVFAGIEPHKPEKVVICHNGDNGPKTIKVSEKAVQKHLDNHGDSLGECDPEACVSNEQCLADEFCKKPVGADVLSEGMCELRLGFACGGAYTPMCGIDGVTYATICDAFANGVNIAYVGECL